MPATKSGNNILINGTGNTLQSVLTDINDVNFFYSPSTNVYTLNGSSVIRTITISNLADLTIGSSSNMAAYERLEFQNGANNRCVMTVNAGGHLKLWGNSELRFARITDGFYGGITNIAGSLTVSGDGINNPLLNNYQRFNITESQNNSTYINDKIYIENAIIGGVTIANGYAFYATNPSGKWNQFIFKSITCDGSYGNWASSATVRFFYYPFYVAGLQNHVFENIYFQNYYYSVQDHVSCLYLKDCTMQTDAGGSYVAYVPQSVGTFSYSRKYSESLNANFRYGQIFSLYDKCNFNSLKHGIYAGYSGISCFKSCTFNQNTGNTFTGIYNGTILLWGNTNVFYRNPLYSLTINSVLHKVFDLNLTITDNELNPISGAIVSINQSQNKEFFTFETNNNGKLNAIHGIECALLTYSQQYANSDISNVDLWSSDTNSTYHTVVITKEGYRPYQQNYIMNQSISETIKLSRINAHSLTF